MQQLESSKQRGLRVTWGSLVGLHARFAWDAQFQWQGLLLPEPREPFHAAAANPYSVYLMPNTSVLTVISHVVP